MGNLQVKPRKDIVITAHIVQIVCVLQIIFLFGMMWATIFAGNTDLTTLYVFQWIMTFVPMGLALLGIIGSLRCWLTLIVIYCIWLILWVWWNIIYVVLEHALAHEPARHSGITTVFIGINIGLAWICLLVCFVFIGLNLGYRRNLE